MPIVPPDPPGVDHSADRPDASFRRCSLSARVARVDPLCRAHVAIELLLTDFAPAEPGQFVEVLCRAQLDERPHAHAWNDEAPPPRLCDLDLLQRCAFLRRPFSLADQWCDGTGAAHVVLISRNVGVGTDWLEHLQTGQSVNLSGPLGRPFRIPPTPRPLVLAGGGVGIPPLLFLSRRLHERGERDVTAIFGATTAELFPVARTSDPPHDAARPAACLRLPGDAPFPAIVTTDDGTLGVRGRVPDAIAAWATTRAQEGRSARSHRPLILACGPEPMLATIAGQSRRLGFDAQLCIERPMGCGLGTCLSCVVRVRDASRSTGWRWALTCTEGPVFDREELFDFEPTTISPQA